MRVCACHTKKERRVTTILIDTLSAQCFQAFPAFSVRVTNRVTKKRKYDGRL